jgi:hypothetical protein
VTHKDQAKLIDNAARSIAKIITLAGALYGDGFEANHGRDAILSRARKKTMPRPRKAKAGEVVT